MKISRRDLSIVMVLLGVIVAFCVYQFYFKNTQDTVEEKQKRLEELQSEKEQINSYAKNEQKYLVELKTWGQNLDAMVSRFPYTKRYDDEIMFLYNLEHDTKYGVYFSRYMMIPDQITATTNGTYYIGKQDDKINTKEVAYTMGQASIEADFDCESYNQMKALLEEINKDENCGNFSEIDMTFDQLTGHVKGTIVTNMYTARDSKNTTAFKPVEIGKVPMRAESKDPCSIFGPTATPEPTLDPEMQALLEAYREQLIKDAQKNNNNFMQ